MMSYRDPTGSVSESQNFVLRLSDDSAVEDTPREPVVRASGRGDVIVISDSSCSTSPVRYETLERESASASRTKSKRKLKYRKLRIFESSSESEGEDEVDDDARRTFAGPDGGGSSDGRCLDKNIVDRTFYTSDETTVSSSSASYGKNVKDEVSECDAKRSYQGPILTFAARKLMESGTNASKGYERRNVRQANKETTPCRTVRSVSSSVASKLNKFSIRNTPQQQNSAGRARLTKEDAYKIFRNIKSTRVVYDSPREKKQDNAIIDESTDADENMIHPAISPGRSNRETCRSENSDVIETSLKDDIIPDSQTDSSKSRVGSASLDAPRYEDLHRPLSERKKKQIAEWLMTNRPDSRSDSSCSQVPASARNSIDSGNSSLERLEVNYETPNNRGKIDTVRTSEKTAALTNSERTVRSNSTRQATSGRFVQKSKTDNAEFRTPDRPTFMPKSHTDNKKTSSVVNTVGNVNIKSCADILAKLYGESWRDKADVLLPATEPRKKVIQTTNRPVQTEQKPILKDRYRMVDSDLDDLVKHNVKSGKKIQRKHKKQDSFINDESLSDGSDSIYHTALTNLRTSTNSKKSTKWRGKSIPASTERLYAICDTDTEDELDDKSSGDSKNLHRKKLSFSDDEDSDTSEFDPGDYVPPKQVSKKGATKILQPSIKISKCASSTTIELVARKSFLASLSNAVPMSSAHPDAEKYRLNYKNTKEELCKELFKLYNEKVFDNRLPRDMTIEWNIRMRGTAGYCYNKKTTRNLTGTVRSSRIVLATKILDTPDRLRDTLIHEMCHAAAWLINDVSDGHGPFWSGWANKAMKMFPELPPIRRCHDYEIKTKFTYKCTGCAYSIGRHSKSLDIEKKRCGHCYGKFELLINKTTKSGTVQVQTPKREPSGFALYVKQNYNSVKKEKNNMKHADVMKVLGQQFSALKIVKKNDLADLKK